jgi:hypothetical protein
MIHPKAVIAAHYFTVRLEELTTARAPSRVGPNTVASAAKSIQLTTIGKRKKGDHSQTTAQWKKEKRKNEASSKNPQQSTIVSVGKGKHARKRIKAKTLSGNRTRCQKYKQGEEGGSKETYKFRA